ncbi:MAG: bifunctional adenosylcobinamide kinase/adenosylcobinamide-phosphate guanylyltransferase [Thermodesulfobacteriota bacterium]|nr:bifunctional adenosylcobinamide kinase/adenosylcobinamide-phosphate guanylyltransferase [Thermodesulfobacteriota bacterium]
MKQLVLGGEKSGKSDFAAALLAKHKDPRLMLATGQALDLGLREQILKHRKKRAPDILVKEIMLDLPEVLGETAGLYGSVLVDSLDFWLFSCLQADRAKERVEALLKSITTLHNNVNVILVSCEAGLGLVSADPVSRIFVRELGSLNRAVAELCDQAYFVVAGRALPLGGP